MAIEWEKLQAEYKLRVARNEEDLFFDPDGPRMDHSITINYVGGTQKNYPMLLKRPKDLCSPKQPKLEVEGITVFDLNQGSLGNCWFVAGATQLATRPDLFKRVIPSDQDFGENYIGAFHFWFWHLGEWVEIIIDDLLPCYHDGYSLRMVYVSNRNEPNEFWAPLLEKAYAKLHGSYNALESGNAEDSMMAISGGVGFRVDTEDGVDFEQVLEWFEHDTLLSCSPKGYPRDRSIQTNHAYTIIKVANVTDKFGSTHRLFCLRNPWGSGEWTGAWSGDSSEWSRLSEEQQAAMNRNKEDGQFWMNFEDFMANFETISGSVLPASTEDTSSTVYAHTVNSEGQTLPWNIVECPANALMKGVTAGGPYGSSTYWENPQYIVDVEDSNSSDSRKKGTLIVTIGRVKRRKLTPNVDQVPMSFDIFQVDEKLSTRLSSRNAKGYIKKHLRKATYKPGTYKEGIIYTYSPFSIQPGRYVVIPSADEPDKEVRFVLRLSSNKVINARLSEERTTLLKIPPMQSRDELWKIYQSHAGPDNQLDASDLQQVLHKVLLTGKQNEPVRVGLETCRSLITYYDTDRCGRVDFDETQTILLEMQRMLQSFEKFAFANTRKVESRHLQELYNEVHLVISPTIMQIIVGKYADRNGHMAFSDFVLCFLKISAIFKHSYKLGNIKKPIDLEELDMCLKFALSS